MNKQELITKVSQLTEKTKVESELFVNAVFQTIEDSLANGEDVKLVGFGNFEVRERAARMGRNPKTGEDIEIPATKVPAFKAGKKLKELVKGS